MKKVANYYLTFKETHAYLGDISGRQIWVWNAINVININYNAYYYFHRFSHFPRPKAVRPYLARRIVLPFFFNFEIQSH